MLSKLTPPTAYYGIAAAHVHKLFNVCVLEKVGYGQIVKNNDLSWSEVEPADVGKCFEGLTRTVIDVAKLQIAAQSHLPPYLRFEMKILAGMHDTPVGFLDAELIKFYIDPELRVAIKERKAAALIHFNVLAAIKSSQIQDFDFGTDTGSYLMDDKDEARLLAEKYDLPKYYSLAKQGDYSAIKFLQLFGALIVQNSVKSLNTALPKNVLSFIQPSAAIGQYLDLPVVIAEMKAEIARQGLDPNAIDLKFPSDERSDYYFNVLRPAMENQIKGFESSLNDPATLLARHLFGTLFKD